MSSPNTRWLVSAGDPKRVSELVERITPDGLRALSDGRVFVDGRRVTDPETALRAGHWVELFAARAIEHHAEVLLASNGIVIANKPVGLATEPDRRGTDSLRSRVARLIDEPEDRLHAISRLDLGVTGVVTFTVTADARRELERARVQGRLHKRYVAIASNRPSDPSGLWNEPLKLRSPQDRVATGKDPRAMTRFRVMKSIADPKATAPRTSQKNAAALWTLLTLEPVTGRTHQLRIHAAQAGAPLLGDGRYGGPERIIGTDGTVQSISRVALHAAGIEFSSATGSRWPNFIVHAPEPGDLVSLWVRLGGETEDWTCAAEEPLDPV